jgi:hypothetical protein
VTYELRITISDIVVIFHARPCRGISFYGAVLRRIRRPIAKQYFTRVIIPSDNLCPRALNAVSLNATLMTLTAEQLGTTKCLNLPGSPSAPCHTHTQFIMLTATRPILRNFSELSPHLACGDFLSVPEA